MCRCAPSIARPAQQRPHPPGGVVAADLGGVGPQQRRERRHLHGQVHARQRSGRVRFEPGLRGPSGRRLGQRVEGLLAARGVTVGLLLGHRGLAEQVHGRGYALVPQAPQNRQRRAWRLPDDEAVGHVLDAARRGGAERAPAGLRVPRAQRRRERRRPSLHLVEVLGQVAGEVVQRPAGGGHVDEPEEGGAQLLVLGGEPHGSLVECPDGMPCRRGKRVVEAAPDGLHLLLGHDSILTALSQTLSIISADRPKE